MSEGMQDYTVVSQVHENKWDDQLQRAVSGWTVTVQDGLTGVVLPVFVSDDLYTVDNVRTLIESQLVPIRQVHFLNR